MDPSHLQSTLTERLTLSNSPLLKFLRARNAVGSMFIAELSNGALVLHRKPKSNHPADNYLEVVLAWFNGKFVTWVVNLQDGGADGGSYFTGREHGSLQQAYLEALLSYDTRGVPTIVWSVAQARIDVPKETVDVDLVEAMVQSQGGDS